MKKIIVVTLSLTDPRRQLHSSSFLAHILRGIPHFYWKLSIYVGHKFQRNLNFI